MPLSPADVHNVAFNKPPIGKRGYNEDEVDQFLDLVEDTLAQLQDENDELRSLLDEADNKSSASAGAGAAASQSSSVDESKLRSEIEADLRSKIEKEIRAEYDEKLNESRKAADKAQSAANEAKAEHEATKKELAQARQLSLIHI